MCGSFLLIARTYAHIRKNRDPWGKKKKREKYEKQRESDERANERVVRDELSREKGWCGESSKRDEELPWWPSKAPIRHEGMRAPLLSSTLSRRSHREPKNTLPSRHAAHSSLNSTAFRVPAERKVFAGLKRAREERENGAYRGIRGALKSPKVLPIAPTNWRSIFRVAKKCWG